ncbi:MAG: LamG domain-containing protein, partial [Planctomycetota bacterium]
NDGTIEGGAAWVPGMLGTALQFNGSDTRIVAPDIPLDNRSFTVAMWVNPQLSSGEQVVYSHGLAGSTNLDLHFRLGGPGSGNVVPGGVRMGFYSNDLDTPALIEVGNWYHIAFWYDFENENRRIYVDGAIAAEAGATPYLGTGSDTILGAWGTGQRYDGMMDDVQVYHRALTDAEVVKIMSGLADQSLAQNPSPADEATDIPRDVVLAWDAGEFAATHDVYFGTSFDDVNDGVGTLVSQGQTETTYDPEGLLEFGQTYFWRIDEVNAAPDNTVYKGEVWSFTVEPFAYAIENVVAASNGASDAGVGPERTIDGSGLNADDQHSTASTDMWLAVPGADALQVQYDFDGVYKLHEMLVWNYNVQFELMLGFGLKDVTVEYSADGETWDVLGDVVFAQATARADYTANTAVAFNGVPAKHVRLTVISGYGPLGQFGLSEVRFMYVPAQAREPLPEDGDTNVLVGTALGWRAGREAVTHDVYLGTDAETLVLVDSVDETTYVPGDLEFGSTYAWRIDEVNEADEVSVWEGPVWGFATQEYAVIDDMESYDDEENRIYDSWLDGFVNGTGSTVGYFEAPFAETTIVNSGSQSMPLEYDNSAAPFHSEAELDLGSMNLTGNGADTLRVFVSGLAPAFNEAADGTILMNAIGTDIWGNADEFRYAYKSLTGNGSMTVLVEDLDETPNSWAKAGVMIRQTTAVGSTHSFMCMTGGSGNGASWQARPTENATSVNTDATAPVAPPYWVRIDRAGDSLT